MVHIVTSCVINECNKWGLTADDWSSVQQQEQVMQWGPHLQESLAEVLQTSAASFCVILSFVR